MRSLDDIRKEEEEERKKNRKDGDPKNTESYTGGEKSGMAVYNPPSADELKNLGAVKEGPAPTDAVAIELYKDGFILDGGKLRSFKDPLNQKFMDELMAGTQPEELGNERVHIKFTDKRTEKYSEPSSMFTSVAPRKQAQAADVSEGATAGPVATGEGDVKIDETKPTTTLQIRYGDGTRKAQKFNQDSTVGDVYSFVAQVTGSTAFSLAGGFPPKPLEDKSITLKDAGLLQAQLMVKS